MASIAIMPLAAFATTYTWNGGASGSLSTAANWSPAPGGAFTASDELVIGSPTKITVDSATTVGTITLTAARNISFLSSGSAGLTVTRIANTGTGVTRFFCPVQFSGTLYVEQNGPVQFPGGATATYPDPALRTSSSSDIARTLDGIFTFTANWNVSRIGDGSHPWIIAPGSEVRGQAFTGSEHRRWRGWHRHDLQELPKHLLLRHDNHRHGQFRVPRAITIAFDGKMPSKVVVCPAGGLTAKEAAEKVRVTEDGVPVEKGYLVSIAGGNITLQRPGFTVFIT